MGKMGNQIEADRALPTHEHHARFRHDLSPATLTNQWQARVAGVKGGAA